MKSGRMAAWILAASVSAIAVCSAAVLAQPADAQTTDSSNSGSQVVASETPTEGQSNWAGYGSAGLSLIPEYEGSNSYVLLPYFEGRLNYKNYYARFEGGAMRFNLWDSEEFHFGPLIGFRRGRGNVNSPVHFFKHLDDSETAGAFLEWEHTAEDPRSGETVYLAADNGVIGEKGGWQVVLRGTARRPIEAINPGFIVSLTGDLAWSSKSYTQKYFGVSASDSLASGLPQFNAGSGFSRAGVALSVDQFLSRHFSVGLRGYYASLIGDSSSSPVTSSSDQFFAGLVFGYVL
jgi:outer membrane scaffolding protein for murein synthesis (MipA/OmpV family)